jgi:hypothetical protein
MNHLKVLLQTTSGLVKRSSNISTSKIIHLIKKTSTFRSAPGAARRKVVVLVGEMRHRSTDEFVAAKHCRSHNY